MSELFIKSERGFELLDELCREPNSEKLFDGELDAFEDMRAGRRLSEKQLLWIQRSALRLDLVEEPVRNSWSSLSPAEQARLRGREVPPAPALLDKPSLPPHRRPKPA